MADFDPSEIIAGTNPFKVINPELVPATRYYDEDYFRLESEAVWGHAWQMATRLENIPNVGDWVEYTILDKSVLVVRAKDGVKAYHNHCRHRGVPVAGGKGNEHGNCAKQGFICPFHGWRWNLDGESTFVYGKHLFSEALLNKQELALKPVRCETLGGEAYINFDDNAPPLREWFGPMADALDARNMSDLRAEWWYGTVLPANWKIAMEAFMEGYHVMKTHPQLQEASPSMYNSRYTVEGATGPIAAAAPKLADLALTLEQNIDAQLQSMALLSEGMAGMLHAKEVEIARSMRDATEGLPEDKNAAVMMWLGAVMQQVTERLQARGEPVPDLLAVAQSDPINAVEFLFPHYFLLPYFTSFSAYRIRPLGPESCFFEIWSLTMFPKGEEPDPVMEPTVLPFDSPDFPPIPRQDYSNIPIQQRGMHAKGFEFMRLSKEIEGLVSNYQRILDGYLAGVPQEKLAKANNLLGGNFDGPIHDLGF